MTRVKAVRCARSSADRFNQSTISTLAVVKAGQEVLADNSRTGAPR